MAEKMELYKFRERPSWMKLAQAVAAQRGDNISEVLRDALRGYARAHQHELPTGPQAADASAALEKAAKESDRG
jgi:hypothetical protein